MAPEQQECVQGPILSGPLSSHIEALTHTLQVVREFVPRRRRQGMARHVDAGLAGHGPAHRASAKPRRLLGGLRQVIAQVIDGLADVMGSIVQLVGETAVAHFGGSDVESPQCLPQ